MKNLLLFILLIPTCFLGHAQGYARLHKKAVVADTHNDILMYTMQGLNIENDLTGKTATDLARLKKGGVDVQVFSIFCDDTFGKDTAFKYANIEIDSLNAIATRNPNQMMVVKNQFELARAIKQKKLAAIIGVEGGHMIEDNLSYLDSLYKRGARYLTLTWNNSTSWASSARDEAENKIPAQNRGLNDFGKTVVTRMNQMGMTIDVSHIGERTLSDVLAITTKPVLASHSSVYAISPHFRNLKDEQIKAIAKNGGVIQINFNSAFLDSNSAKKAQAFGALHKSEIDSLAKTKKEWEVSAYLRQKYPQETAAISPSMSVLLDHIDHIVKLVGVNFVGLGSDFDGIPSSPKELQNVTQFPNITKGLLERGYSRKDIKKILGRNFIRVFKANVQ